MINPPLVLPLVARDKTRATASASESLLGLVTTTILRLKTVTMNFRTPNELHPAYERS